MKYVMHRVNDTKVLEGLDPEMGAEVDIRSNRNELIVVHDPFEIGESFDTWLKKYRGSLLIVNFKEEGLESRCLELLTKYRITNYFFLDQSMPFFIKWALQSHTKQAVRFSEYEPMVLAGRFSGLVDWVWVDSFTEFSHSAESLKTLSDYGFKLCMVSPELQGRDEGEILKIAKSYDVANTFSAVCTKKPEIWKSVCG